MTSSATRFFFWAIYALFPLLITPQIPESMTLIIYIADSAPDSRPNAFPTITQAFEFLNSSLYNKDYNKATIFFTKPIEYYYPMRYNNISLMESSIKSIDFIGVYSGSDHTQIRLETLSRAVEYRCGAFSYVNIEFLFSSIRGDTDSLVQFKFCSIKFENITIDFDWKGHGRLFLFNIIGGSLTFINSEIAGKSYFRTILLRTISSNSSLALKQQVHILKGITVFKCEFANSSLFNSHSSYYSSTVLMNNISVVNVSLTLVSSISNITANKILTTVNISRISCHYNTLSSSSILSVEYLALTTDFRIYFTLLEVNFSFNVLKNFSGFSSIYSNFGNVYSTLYMNSALFLQNSLEKSSKLIDFIAVNINNTKFIGNQFDSKSFGILIANTTNFFRMNIGWKKYTVLSNILFENNNCLPNAAELVSIFKQDNITFNNIIFVRNKILLGSNNFMIVTDSAEIGFENISFSQNERIRSYILISNVSFFTMKNSYFLNLFSRGAVPVLIEGFQLYDIDKCIIYKVEFDEPIGRAFRLQENQKRNLKPRKNVYSFYLSKTVFLANFFGNDPNQKLFSLSLQSTYKIDIRDIVLSINITEDYVPYANWIYAPYSSLNISNIHAENAFIRTNAIDTLGKMLEFRNCIFQVSFLSVEFSKSFFIGANSSLELTNFDFYEMKILFKRVITLTILSSEIVSSKCSLVEISDSLNNVAIKFTSTVFKFTREDCAENSNLIYLHHSESEIDFESYITFSKCFVQTNSIRGQLLQVFFLTKFNINFKACLLKITNIKAIKFESNPAANSSINFNNTCFYDGENKLYEIHSLKENTAISCILLINTSITANSSIFEKKINIEGKRINFNLSFVYQIFECLSCDQLTVNILSSAFLGFSFNTSSYKVPTFIIHSVFHLDNRLASANQSEGAYFNSTYFSDGAYNIDSSTIRSFENRNLHQNYIFAEQTLLIIENCIFAQPFNKSSGSFITVLDGKALIIDNFFGSPLADKFGHSIFLKNTDFNISSNFFILSECCSGSVISIITTLGSGEGNISRNNFVDFYSSNDCINSFVSAGLSTFYGHYCHKRTDINNSTYNFTLTCNMSDHMAQYEFVFDCAEKGIVCGTDSVLGAFSLFQCDEGHLFDKSESIFRRRVHSSDKETDVVNVSLNRYLSNKQYRVFNFFDSTHQTSGVPFLTNFTLNPDFYENKDSLFSINIRLCTTGFIYNKILNSCVKCSQGKYSLSAVADVCNICPELADCYDGKLTVKESFWRPHRFSEKIYFCDRNPESCLKENNFNDNILCLEGYKGPKCESCEYENGWVRFFEFSCAKCGSSVTPFLMSILMFITQIAFLFYTCYNWSVTINMQINRSASEENLVRSRRHMSLFLNILYFFLQMMSVRISPRLENRMGILNMILMLGLPSVLFSYKYCIFIKIAPSYPLYADLIYILILPALKGLALMIFMNFLRKKKGLFKNSPKKHTYFLTLVILFNSEFYSLLSELFSFLSCVNINSNYYIKKDIQFSCQDSYYQIFRALVMIPGVVLWAIVFPFLIFYNIMTNRKTLNSVRNLTIFGSLTIGYQKNVFYWELYKFLFKILILMINQFINYHPMRYIFYILLFLTYGFSVRTLRPYYSDKFNRLEMTQSVILILLPILELYGTTILLYKRLDMASLDITEGFVNFISVFISILHRVIIFSYVFYLVINIFIQLKYRLTRLAAFLGKGFRKQNEETLKLGNKNIIGKKERML